MVLHFAPGRFLVCCPWVVADGLGGQLEPPCGASGDP